MKKTIECKWCGEALSDEAYKKSVFCCVQHRRLFNNAKRNRRFRACIRCGRKFLSEGPWRRVCSHCMTKESKGLRIPDDKVQGSI